MGQPSILLSAQLADKSNHNFSFVQQCFNTFQTAVELLKSCLSLYCAKAFQKHAKHHVQRCSTSNTFFTLAPKQHEQISISKVTFVGSRAWLNMNCFSGVSLINPHMLRKFALATLPPNCCGARNHRGIYWWHLVAQQYTCCFENGMRFYAKRGSTFFRKVVSKHRDIDTVH